jgi:hypothetical protein
MTLDGKVFCYTSAATIRQLLDVLLIWVTRRWNNVVWLMNTGERRERDRYEMSEENEGGAKE